MAQILRKDCVKSADIDAADDGRPNTDAKADIAARTTTRPLMEITTSGMTHSWGTSFSSQIKNHRLPRWPYAYFVSWTFMTICHLVCPWWDIVVRTPNDSDDAAAGVGAGSMGLQYHLGPNFAEFEFDFDDDHAREGALTVRIFGPEVNGPPKLQMKYTFDELSSTSTLPSMMAKMPQDFLTVQRRTNSNTRRGSHVEEVGWTFVPHRGLASLYCMYVANVVLFLAFCFLFFLPHGSFVLIVVIARRRWSRRKNGD